MSAGAAGGLLADEPGSNKAGGLGRESIVSRIGTWTRSGLSLEQDLQMALASAHLDSDCILQY